MIHRDQYVPVLKGKMGEFLALRELPNDIKEGIVPLIDIVHCPIGKSFESHVRSTAKYICKYWPSNRMIYIDGYMVDARGMMEGGIHPMEEIHNVLRSSGPSMVPVVNSITSPSYNAVIKRICDEDLLGVCIRIFCSRFGELKSSNEINDEISRLVDFIGLNKSQIDLVLDLRSIENHSVDFMTGYSAQMFERLSHLENWRSLVLTGSNFPLNLSHFSPNNVHLLERNEWSIWTELVNNRRIRRIPSYSDFAISHPNIIEYDSATVNVSASIRYTGLENYHIYRGRGTRQEGFEQFFDLAEALTLSPEFRGRAFSSGDEFIYECATLRDKTGNPMTWRKVGTNHHITTVVIQLRQFFRDLMASRTS